MKRRRRRIRYQRGGVFKGTNRQRGRKVIKRKQTGGFLPLVDLVKWAASQKR